MTPQTDQMEQMLATLGKAHRQAAFSDDATRYPWRTTAPEAVGPTRRRFAWANVAVPLAAAAAVAVLFVGPSLWSPRALHDVAENTLTVEPSVKPAEAPAIVEPAGTTTGKAVAEADDCDFNGDGEINGKDIQAFVSSLDDTNGDTILEAQYLQRCLLDGA